MSFVIDTNVAIHLRDHSPSIASRTAALEGEICLSIISRVELEGGVFADAHDIERRRARLAELLTAIRVLEFDESCADAYREIVESAGYSRRKVFDRMIAAQALVHQAILVTCNGENFRDVPGLRLLEWPAA